MGSSNFRDLNLGNERSGSSSSSSSSYSSRKGKKSNSDKHKQPQRGLGVAQLEKIRLQSELGNSYLPSLHSPYSNNPSQEDMRLQTAYASSSSSTSPYGFHGHQSITTGMSEIDRANIRYVDSQPSTAPRWHASNLILETQHFTQPGMTRHFLNIQESVEVQRNAVRTDSMGSGNPNSESNDSQELDLELRLSL